MLVSVSIFMLLGSVVQKNIIRYLPR